MLEQGRKELDLLERRLLVVLDGMPPGDVERRQAMEKTLANIRRQRDALDLLASGCSPSGAAQICKPCDRAAG